ncbi:MAG: carbohydrate binding family 9 domain-containing protein [bacterium]
MLRSIKLAVRQFILFFLLLNVSASQAQMAADDSSNDTSGTTARIAYATHVETPPTLDGEVVNDAAWQAAKPTSGFWQTTPLAGVPASEKTRVGILYTATTLYVGVICYDREPEGIVVADSRRDSPLNQSDSFQIILDTFDDDQNGFLFATNPAGIEYDAQVTNEGEGPRFSRRGAGGFNLNWDGSWQVQTRISDAGWSAEFAIPFRFSTQHPAS